MICRVCGIVHDACAPKSDTDGANDSRLAYRQPIVVCGGFWTTSGRDRGWLRCLAIGGQTRCRARELLAVMGGEAVVLAEDWGLSHDPDTGDEVTISVNAEEVTP